MTTPFPDDHDHASYDTDAVARFLRILQWSADVLEEFAGWYCGKSQPGAPVLARLRPRHEQVLGRAGRRPIGRRRGHGRGVLPRGHQLRVLGRETRTIHSPPTTPTPHPNPRSSRTCALRPAEASWAAQANGSLAILRYDDVRSAPDPKATLLDFLQSAYEAGASLAGWDLADTATQWCPVPFERLTHLSRPATTAKRGTTT